jgi:hypothetical protein
MVMRYEREIEDVRNHPVETVLMLRNLLADGAVVIPDPKRADFYEVESDSLVYYIHVSPVSGKVLLLATWPTEAAHAVA